MITLRPHHLVDVAGKQLPGKLKAAQELQVIYENE